MVSSLLLLQAKQLNYLEHKSFHIFKSTVHLEDKFLEVEFLCQRVYVLVSDLIKLPSKGYSYIRTINI